MMDTSTILLVRIQVKIVQTSNFTVADVFLPQRLQTYRAKPIERLSRTAR